MRIIVTGSNGFIGSHLAVTLLTETDHDIFPISRRVCDLTDEYEVREMIKRIVPDVIFHLAANPLVKAGGTELGRSNITATHNLLEYAPPGARFVFASSATVYGRNAEDYPPANELTALDPNSIYGATKVASEALVMSYHRLNRISGLILRYVANVGSFATHGVVKDVIEKLKSDSPTLELLGEAPGSLKHFTHVSDTVRATIDLGLNPIVNGPVNIANDDQISVLELAKVIMDTLGIHKEIVWLGKNSTWAGDNKVVRISNLLAKVLGWVPRYPKSADAVAKAVKDMTR